MIKLSLVILAGGKGTRLKKISKGRYTLNYRTFKENPKLSFNNKDNN